MKQEYLDWIDAHLGDETGYGDCQEHAVAMAQAFPQLKVVSGHYYCLIWGERGHWWCVDQDGTIVDPTAGQFPSKGMGQYVEYTGDGSDLPTGVCMNCGGPVYDGDTFCSDACGAATITYLNTGIL